MKRLRNGATERKHWIVEVPGTRKEEVSTVPYPGEWEGPDIQTHTKHKEHNMELTTEQQKATSVVAKSLRFFIQDEQPSSPQLDEVGSMVWELSQSRDDSEAVAWHLAADAARMKALSRQERASVEHVHGVLNTCLKRLDREIEWAQR